MSYIGTTEIGKMFLGDIEIDKAYLGVDLVYQENSEPTPVIEPVFYDFLVFDGTAYIDTTITPQANSSFLVSLGNETIKAAQRLFMCSGENSTNIGAILGSSTSSSRRYFSIYYGASSVVSSNRYLNFTYTDYNFFLTPKRFGWGNTANTISKGSNSPNGPLVLGYSTAHAGQPYTGTMKTFTLYDSSAQNVTSASGFSSYTPYATLRPCTYNNVAGMWYVEGNRFFGNSAGSGTLTVRNA